MKVGIVETAGNDPKKWVSLFKAAGCICIHKAVTIRHALSAERIGVDIVRCAVMSPHRGASRHCRIAPHRYVRSAARAPRRPRIARGTDASRAVLLSVDAFECAGHPGEADVGGMVLFAKAAKKLTKPWSVFASCARRPHAHARTLQARVGRHWRRQAARRVPGARRGWREHGHSILRHQGAPPSPQPHTRGGG